MSKQADRAMEAVKAGAVRHAHPFTWAVDLPFLDVRPAQLQRLARLGRIRVVATSPEYWRPVVVAETLEARK